MSDLSKAYLKDLRTGILVEAVLIDGVSREQVEAAEADWRPEIDKKLRSLEAAGAVQADWPEHAHWDWRRKHADVEGLIAYRMFGLECDGQMQGLMLVSTAQHFCRIPSQLRKELVYVDYLASAPWNSPALVKDPRYALVGKVFISTAIQLSLEEGFKGRIGLHSLPQADSYYAGKCGMTDLGRDAKKERLKYFEMTPEQASAFLS